MIPAYQNDLQMFPIFRMQFASLNDLCMALRSKLKKLDLRGNISGCASYGAVSRNFFEEKRTTLFCFIDLCIPLQCLSKRLDILKVPKLFNGENPHSVFTPCWEMGNLHTAAVRLFAYAHDWGGFGNMSYLGICLGIPSACRLWKLQLFRIAKSDITSKVAALKKGLPKRWLRKVGPLTACHPPYHLEMFAILSFN